MKYFIDILVIAILICTAVNGYKKGFLRYILGTLSAVAVVITAYLLTNAFSNSVYERFIQPSVTDFIVERIENVSVSEILNDEMTKLGYDIDIPDNELNDMLKSEGNISKVISKKANIESNEISEFEKELDIFFEKRFPSSLNSFFKQLDFDTVSKKTEYSKNVSYDIVRALANKDAERAAMYLEQSLVKPFAMAIVSIVMFILLYVLLTIVLKVILRITGVLNYIPLANGLNRFMGVAAGLFKGLLYLSVITYILGFALKISGDLITIKTEIIEKTILYKYIFNLICG